MPDSAKFVVDLEAMQELSDRMALIHHSLESVNDQLNAYADEIGSPKVRRTLDGFVSGWHDGRKKIESNIWSLLQKTRGAAQAYLQDEQQQCRSFQVTGEP